MPERRRIIYRPMLASDVQAAMYVRKAALDHNATNEGRTPNPWVARVAPFVPHIIGTDGGGSWVAEVEGLAVGYAQAIVRGDIWFLAQLFVHPEMHALGIGQELLRRTKAYGAARGVRVYSVVSSTSPVAQSLYMRSGMFGIGIGYVLTGSVESLLTLPAPDEARKRIVDCGGWQDKIASLDAEVFGAERREDHAMMLSDDLWHGEKASFGINRDGELLGYGYVDALDGEGWIAPLAAREPAGQLPLLRMAGEWLRDREIATARTWTLTQNATILGALLDRGWRIGGWTFFLSTERWGRFDRYQPINGMML